MATWYVDLEASFAANGNSFATRTSNLAGIVNSSATGGDEVRVMASTAGTAIGGATFNNLSTVTIPANTVKVLYNDGAWTAGANVTAATSTTRKQGATSATLAINLAAFTTGTVGYYNTGTTNNLSGYNKICFWFRTTVAITNASIYSIRLCSDASGAVPVNTLQLPAIAIAINTWVPIVLDNGGALSSTVQSVALYVPTTDPGAPTLAIDNLMACNDVTLRTLISKNNANGPWFAIRSITNDAGADTITIDSGLNSAVATQPAKGFFGTTESTTAYVSDGISLGASAAAAITTTVFGFTKTAPAASPISIVGGWDRTNMSTSGGYTHINGLNGNGRIFAFTSGGYLSFQNFIISNCYTGLYISTDNLTFDKFNVTNTALTAILGNAARTNVTITNSNVNSANVGLNIVSKNCVFSNCTFLNSVTDGIAVGANSSATLFDSCTSANNTITGLTVPTNANSANLIFKDCVFNNNTTYGLEFVDPLYDFKIINTTINSNGSGAIFSSRSSGDIFGLSTSGNNNVGIYNSGVGSVVNINNWVFNESTVISNFSNYDSSIYTSVNHNGAADDHRIYTDGGTISSDTSVRYSATGISWKLQPTSTIRTDTYPLVQPIKGVPVKANVQHTFSIQARRSSTSLTLNFGIEEQTIAGITAQEVSLSATADTWQQLSITLTPTADAVIDLYVSAYGGTNLTGYWDDFTVTATGKNAVATGNYGYYDGGAYVSNYPPGEHSYISVS